MGGLTEHPDMFMVVMPAYVSDAVSSNARDQALRFARQAHDFIEALIREGRQAQEVIAGDLAQLAWLPRFPHPGVSGQPCHCGSRAADCRSAH